MSLEDPTPRSDPPPAPGGANRSKLDISSSLLGPMPCASCGYDLQGLSVLGNCPECGAAVRGTILAIVDPLAEELRPIIRPRLVAIGLVTWTLGSLVAALTAWVATGVTFAYGKQGLGTLPWLVQHAPEFICGELWLAGLGAIVLCHPHRSVGAANVLLALLGAASYIPLGLVARKLSELAITHVSVGRIDLWVPAPDRTILRVGACLLTVIIIASIRPVARVLVARSLALRTGRVDRQTMLAVGTAAAIVIAGDGLGSLAMAFDRTGETFEILRMLGGVVMVLGGGLLTLGVAGMVVDAVRIAAAVMAPSPSLRQVLRGPEQGTSLRSEGARGVPGEEVPTRGGGQ